MMQGLATIASLHLRAWLVGAITIFLLPTWASADECDGREVTVTLTNTYFSNFAQYPDLFEDDIAGSLTDADGNVIVALPGFNGASSEHGPTCLAYGSYTVEFNTESDPHVQQLYEGYGGFLTIEATDSYGTVLVNVNGINYTDTPETITATIVIEAAVFGCTDSNATNHAPAANIDDGSCNYDCDGTLVTITLRDAFGDGNPGVGGSIRNASGVEVIALPPITGMQTVLANQCLPDGDYTITYGSDRWASEFSCQISTEDGTVIGLIGGFADGAAGETPTLTGSFSLQGGASYGCTNPNASNYDASATIDDGTCILFGATCAEEQFAYEGLNVGHPNYPWFTYTAPYTGLLTISSCVDGNNDIDHDTRVVVYGSCDDYLAEAEEQGVWYYNGVAAAEDSECPGRSYMSTVTFLAQGGVSYHIYWPQFVDYGPHQPFGFEVTLEEDLYGCLEPEAVNYNPDATIHDSERCQFDCDGEPVLVHFQNAAYLSDGGSAILNTADAVIHTLDPIEDGNSRQGPFCLAPGGYSISLEFSEASDYYTGVVVTPYGDLETLIALGNAHIWDTDGDGSSDNTLSFTIGAPYGCTDPQMLNYDPDANADNGTCNNFDALSCNDTESPPTQIGAGTYEVPGRQSAWFTYIPDATGFITISSCAGDQNNEDHDTRVYIYDACGEETGSNLNSEAGLVGGNDDGESRCGDHTYGSFATWAVTEGTTYYIFWPYVSNWGPQESFTFSIEPTDCAGVIDGMASIDQCNVCDDDSSNDNACMDECNVPNGDGAPTWYADADGDGYGNPNSNTQACTRPGTYVNNADDLDDSSDCAVGESTDTCGVCSGPGPSTWYADADGDGYGNASDADTACYQPAGYVDNDLDREPASDCDISAIDDCGVCDGTGQVDWYADTDGDGLGAGDATSSCLPPTATAVDNADDTAPDCTSNVIDECAVCNGPGASTWYADTDDDGYGDAATSQDACENPAGYVANQDDLEPASDCADGTAVDDCGVCGGVGPTTWFNDDDADGLGDANRSWVACSQPDGYVEDDRDRSPNCATNVIDICGVCDGTGEPTWYADADGDGRGDPGTTTESCPQPDGYVLHADDHEPNSSCAAEDLDVCGVCNGDGYSTWYADTDGDGLGDPNRELGACRGPPGYVNNGTDREANSNCLTETIDACGVCNGPGLLPWYPDTDGDGMGEPGGDTLNACIQPAGYSSNQNDPAADCTSNAVDECGVCDGPGVTTWYSDTDGDGLGYLFDAEESCTQPEGYVTNADDTQPNCATNTEDECGVCDVDPANDNTTCLDCADVINGTAYIDQCDECVGGDTGNTACEKDCNNEWGGTATEDECGVCDGTGITAGACDCSGNVNDACGVCGGDGSTCTDEGGTDTESGGCSCSIGGSGDSASWASILMLAAALIRRRRRAHSQPV